MQKIQERNDRLIRTCGDLAPAIAERQREERRRKEKMRIEALAATLGVRYSHARVSLDRYQIYHDAQPRAIAAVKRAAENLETLIRNGQSIIFYGTVGTGKDHLLAWLLYRACEVTSVHWINGQELHGEMRDRIETHKREREIVSRLATPGVLAISDPIPPAGDASDWKLETLYRVLDARNRELKPTWATINACDDAEMDSRLSSPVWDRWGDHATLIPCQWPSYRTKKRCSQEREAVAW
jgi:DNA replication protein DnaC